MRIYRERSSLKLSLVALAAAFLIASCGGSDAPPAPPTLSVSPASIDADAAGGDVTVNVTVSGGSLNWTASVPSDVGWARISSGSSGAATGTVRIQVDANTGAARNFDLSVAGGSASAQTVTINQAQAPQTISLTVDSLELDREGGSVTVQVSNSGSGTLNWTASVPDDIDWAYIESGESGTDSGSIVVQYGINGGADRNFPLNVSASSASNSPQAVTFSQEWFGTSACTYSEGREEVLDVMEEIYYFNDESAQAAKYDALVLADHSTLNSMLDELRWMPDTHDRGFSYWLTKAQSDAIFAAETSAFGFRLLFVVDAFTNPLYLQILDVYEGSPAAIAGLARGDKIHSLNGKAISTLSLDEINVEFGPADEGHQVTFEIEKLSGTRSTFNMAKARFQIPTVPAEQVAVFDTTAGKVGYLHFRTFFGDANERLLTEFAEFKTQGVQHLIVDLRYNGGGSVPIANGLASLIGGPELFEGGRRTVQARRVHNNSNAWRDQTAYFGCETYGSEALVAKCEQESSLRALENVVFITSRSSASASELVITALQPHENVTLVGDRTYGKPVGQYGLGFCLATANDYNSALGILWPVSFATVNSEGFEDYYNGLAVDCQVPDDRANPLGSASEGRIAAALRYIETGSCATASSAQAAGQQDQARSVQPTDPVRQLLGY